jgi:hypothetical protein
VWIKHRSPLHEEIGRIRRLIERIGGDLDQLTEAERVQLDQAIAAVRRHRTVMLGMPRIRPSAPDVRPERTA